MNPHLTPILTREVLFDQRKHFCHLPHVVHHHWYARVVPLVNLCDLFVTFDSQCAHHPLVALADNRPLGESTYACVHHHRRHHVWPGPHAWVNLAKNELGRLVVSHQIVPRRELLEHEPIAASRITHTGYILPRLLHGRCHCLAPYWRYSYALLVNSLLPLRRRFSTSFRIVLPRHRESVELPTTDL